MIVVMVWGMPNKALIRGEFLIRAFPEGFLEARQQIVDAFGRRRHQAAPFTRLITSAETSINSPSRCPEFRSCCGAFFLVFRSSVVLCCVVLLTMPPHPLSMGRHQANISAGSRSCRHPPRR